MKKEKEKESLRVAVWVSEQVIMDIQSGTSAAEIKQEALRAYKNIEGQPEIGVSLVRNVTVHPTSSQLGKIRGTSAKSPTLQIHVSIQENIEAGLGEYLMEFLHASQSV